MYGARIRFRQIQCLFFGAFITSLLVFQSVPPAFAQNRITIEVDITPGGIEVHPNPTIVSNGDIVTWHVNSNTAGATKLTITLPAKNSPFGNLDDTVFGWENPRWCNFGGPPDPVNWPQGVEVYYYYLRSNSPEEMEATVKLCIDVSCGGDPPIYKNIMVFPTQEHFLGSDLNGDSDTNDTVLRYWNLKTGEVINTGLIVSGNYRAVDIYENTIAFVGEGSQIRYYDIDTGEVGETGAAGSHPTIHGNIIAFDSGDTICYFHRRTGSIRSHTTIYENTTTVSSRDTICYFDLSSQTLVDTKIPGDSPVIYKNLIVFCAFDPEPTIWTYDLCTGIAIDTGVIGVDPALYETEVVFVTRENSLSKDLNDDGDTYDLVLRHYDLETQTLINTGIVGRYPAFYGSRIAFTTPEVNVNQDLNEDGRIMGSVIRYYDLRTGKISNTHQLGTEPDIYGDTITFYLWEKWIGEDLNGDGDMSDPIVDTCQITEAKRITMNLKIWLFLAF